MDLFEGDEEKLNVEQQPSKKRKKSSLARKANANILDEIMTRKDTGSIAAALHKKHLSVYNHIRKMKKRGSQSNVNATGAINNEFLDRFDSLQEEVTNDPVGNSDLYCVATKHE